MAKRLRNNFIALIFLQGGQYAASIITLPILATGLGPSGYGQIGFAIAITTCFCIFADWGFGLSATKQIAIHRSNKRAVSKIFWSVFFSRIILGIVGAVVLWLLTMTIKSLEDIKGLLFCGYLTVLSVVFSPAFYYQAIEKLEFVNFINLVSRFLAIPFIYLLVHTESDAALAIGIPSTALLISSCTSLIILLYSGAISWIAPTSSSIGRSIKNSYSLFLTTASIGIYSNSVIIVLGFVANALSVGYFAFALNLVRATQGILLSPLSMVLFPRISHLFYHSRQSAIAMLRKVFIFQVLLSLFVLTAMFILAPFVIGRFIGEAYQPSIIIFQILSPLFLLGGLSNFLGGQVMIVLGHHSIYTNIVLASSAIVVSLVGTLGFYFGLTGASIAMLLTELLLVCGIGIYLYRFEYDLFGYCKI